MGLASLGLCVRAYRAEKRLQESAALQAQQGVV